MTKQSEMNQPLNLSEPLTVAGLRHFRVGLTRFDMTLILDQALFLLDHLYAHLVLKRAIHGIDPVAKLRRLRDAMSHQPDELRFNRDVELAFQSLQDLHTQYVQPFPLKKTTVFLPFIIERYFGVNRWHYIVTQTREDFGYGFGPGVEVTHFNGVPIEQAILNNAATSGGSNPAAFFASGLYALTSRSLAHTTLPDDDWVVVSYLVRRQCRHIRIPWRVSAPPPDKPAPATDSGFGGSVNAHHRKIMHFRQTYFGPDAPEAQPDLSKQSKYPNQLQFGVKKTPHGEFGWLRIWSFSAQNPQDFIAEVARIVRLLPTEGLIIDIRANPGGIIPVGESILQFFTDKPIVPEPLHFRATSEALALAEADPKLARWAPAIDRALDTGELYSAGFPMTPPEWLSRYGRIYPGKTVLIVDALVYSTASFFAAGYQDNEIGPIIGLDNNIGGGGANVWEHDDIAAVYPRTRVANPLEPMPLGTNISLAMLQSSRVGKNANMLLSELGLKPDYRYLVSRRDLAEDFVGLFDFAGEVLAGQEG